eukprot:1553304-Prymnesium_polylepis.1
MPAKRSTIAKGACAAAPAVVALHDASQNAQHSAACGRSAAVPSSKQPPSSAAASCRVSHSCGGKDCGVFFTPRSSVSRAGVHIVRQGSGGTRYTIP